MRPMTIWGQDSIDDPQNVFPSHIGAQTADVWHPILRCLAEAFHIAVSLRQSNLTKCRWVFPAQARIAADAALAAGTGQTSLGALVDQGALELRCSTQHPAPSTQHLKSELALWADSVNRIFERAEEGAFAFQSFNYLKQVRQRPRKAVDPHDDQRVAFLDPL